MLKIVRGGWGSGQPLGAHYRVFNSLENLTKSEEEEEEWLNLDGRLREEAGPPWKTEEGKSKLERGKLPSKASVQNLTITRRTC